MLDQAVGTALVSPCSSYCLRVGERAQSVIVLLSSCVPQTQVDWFSINHYIGRVVVKTKNKERVSCISLQ